jgi:hypothetical protein
MIIALDRARKHTKFRYGPIMLNSNSQTMRQVEALGGPAQAKRLVGCSPCFLNLGRRAGSINSADNDGSIDSRSVTVTDTSKISLSGRPNFQMAAGKHSLCACRRGRLKACY